MPHVSYLGVMPGPRTLNGDDDDEHPGENMSTPNENMRLLYKNYYNHRRDNNHEGHHSFILKRSISSDICPILSPFTYP